MTYKQIIHLRVIFQEVLTYKFHIKGEWVNDSFELVHEHVGTNTQVLRYLFFFKEVSISSQTFISVGTKLII